MTLDGIEVPKLPEDHRFWVFENEIRIVKLMGWGAWYGHKYRTDPFTEHREKTEVDERNFLRRLFTFDWSKSYTYTYYSQAEFKELFKVTTEELGVTRVTSANVERLLGKVMNLFQQYEEDNAALGVYK